MRTAPSRERRGCVGAPADQAEATVVCFLNAASSLSLVPGPEPTSCSTTLPPLNSSSVGIDFTMYLAATRWLWSMSSLPTFTCPAYLPARLSTMGAMARQGPHQTAQKSTSVG